MSTIYLPVALISLWGDGMLHPSPDVAAHFLRILDHTMALVSAVYLVCKQTTSQACVTAYLDCITRYIRDLQKLHPHADYCTNHHVAIHIYDFLLLFGPVQSWWCFPFERLIGQIQWLSSNHKFGK